jgi:hypothetical protein
VSDERPALEVLGPKTSGTLKATADWLWPGDAVEEYHAGIDTRRYISSYLFMRFAIGILGVGLLLQPFAEPLVFDGQPFLRGSLSAYYYSGMREIFIGVLWAIGVFLITYKVAERSRESRVSTYAGMAAILVAIFPTQRPGSGFPLTPLQTTLGESTVEAIHFGAAAVFISLLAQISFYFGRYGRARRRLHFAAAGTMVAALALAASAALTGEPDKGLLIAEVVAVLAFTTSWLAKVEFVTSSGRRDSRESTASG